MSAAPPVVLLCGGQGTRIREHAPHLPKPMVEVGGQPLLWHILRHYAAHGHRRFVLCLGHLGEVIRGWAAADPLPGLQIELVDTGVHAMTGARVRRVAERLGDAPRFHLTYVDAVSDVDLTAHSAFHAAHGRLATVTG
ncbi:MAG: NTP transferase domain-containing protein, partial [bacterium]